MSRQMEQNDRVIHWWQGCLSDTAGRSYVSVEGEDTIMLDGTFTVEELKAIVAIMETTPR